MKSNSHRAARVKRDLRYRRLAAGGEKPDPFKQGWPVFAMLLDYDDGLRIEPDRVNTFRDAVEAVAWARETFLEGFPEDGENELPIRIGIVELGVQHWQQPEGIRFHESPRLVAELSLCGDPECKAHGEGAVAGRGFH